MSSLTKETPVGQWVARQPELARVFEDLQIDYCCGGELPLKDACRERGLEPNEVLERLVEAERTTGGDANHDWLHMPLTQLCDHIEATHHGFMRRELPRLESLLGKVINAHAERHSELHAVRDAFAALRAEVEPHMMKEERILFPAIRQMERAGAAAIFPFGSVANPIRVMEDEHDNAGQALHRMRELTRGYEPPDDACNSYRALLDGLRELEADLHQHIHKENNILFPRAIEMETVLAAASN